MNKQGKKRLTFRKNDIVWMILSLLVSIGLWISVTKDEMNVTPVPITDVPIVFVGEELLGDSKLIVTSRSSETVTLIANVAKGQEKKIKDNPPVVKVDLRGINTAGTNDITVSIDWGSSEFADVEIKAEPENVRVRVEKLQSVFIPVRLDPLPDDCTQGYLSDDHSKGRYILASDEPEYSPKEIRITGPDSVVRQIEYAKVTLDRHNLTETATGEAGFTLMNTDGTETDLKWITRNTDQISYKIPVGMEKTVPLTARIESGCGATEENTVVTIDPPSITLTGDEKDLSIMDEIVLGSIDLSGFIQPSSQTFSIPLPSEVNNMDGVTTATVTVDFVGVETKVISTTDIQYENVPDGYHVKLNGGPLEFLIRGPEKSMPLIDESSFLVRADVGRYAGKAGQPFTVPVTILVFEYNDVGVFGDYTIVVTLEEGEAADDEELLRRGTTGG